MLTQVIDMANMKQLTLSVGSITVTEYVGVMIS